ncbi:MAG TPA: energy transducer TonB [Steroidobacteraceae bacterium]|jgi:protein TonB|nr:energy transducer TonB [Steroidobacteraceae bacterium]
MSAYIEQDSMFLTRRGVVVGAILALHVFIAWALATGLAHKMIEALAPPIQTVIQEEIKTQEAPPPPPPPQFERPPVEIPPSDTVIELPQAQAATTAITNTTTQHVAPAPVAHASVRTPVGPGKGFPNSDEYYPPASRRLEEQGMAVVNVCVGPDGKLTGAPTIDKSSGSVRLDEGAIKLTTAASGRYKPAMEDGKPVAGCNKLGIRFQLR